MPEVDAGWAPAFHHFCPKIGVDRNRCSAHGLEMLDDFAGHGLGIAIEPVSYTHLDVYTRQVVFVEHDHGACGDADQRAALESNTIGFEEFTATDRR